MEINTRTNSLSIEQHSDGYLTYFPALEGYNTWGKTYEEAIKHVEETLTLYLESFDELGKSIPEERGLKQPVSLGVTVRIPVIA
jgi:predicted RNase H-like HicB family nuclease